jgi:pimeloyl-ACP methyl ester carboxylesterase
MLTRRLAAAGLLLAGCATIETGPELLTFPAEDGVPVSGYAYGRGERGVILVPGGNGVGSTWHPQARRLARAGFRVIAIDYRGFGRSHQLAAEYDKVHLDVLGAARQLRREGARSVYAIGASSGAGYVGGAAIQVPRLIDGAVLLAGGIGTPDKLGGRKLFIIAEGDLGGDRKPRLEAIRKQYEAANEPKQLVVLPGAGHAQLIFLTTESDRLLDEIMRFLTAD